MESLEPVAFWSLSTAEEIQTDAVVIVTDHYSYDYQWILDHASLVIDTRNATKQAVNGKAKIIK